MTPAAALKRLAAVSVPALGPGFMGFVARWSWAQYLWAFASPTAGKPLRLSADAERIAGRRKALLSEQLGIALGLSLMEQYLKLTDPTAHITMVDADVAIAAGRAGHFEVGMRAKGGTRPDYFVIKEPPGRPIQIYSLECKGGSSRPGKKDLAAAAKQLQGVGIIHSGGFHPPPGVLVATAFRKSGILSEAFDPEGDEIWTGPAAERPRERRPAVERHGGLDVVTDASRFRRLLLEIDQATLLEIGRGPADGDLRPAEFVENPLGVFRGATYTVPLSTHAEADVFLGVERSIFDSLLKGDRESIAATRADWATRVSVARVSMAEHDPPVERDVVYVDERGLEAYAVDERGLLLRLRARHRGSFPAPIQETTR